MLDNNKFEIYDILLKMFLYSHDDKNTDVTFNSIMFKKSILRLQLI